MLRHTNASLLLSAGADVKTVADRLSHANPALLFNTYAHLILSADRAAAERLEAVFGWALTLGRRSAGGRSR